MPVEPLVGVPDEEQVVRAGRDDGPQQPPLPGVEVLGLVHHDGPVGQRRPLQFEQAPGVPDHGAPLGLAPPEQGLDVVLDHLPDLLTLEAAQGPSPPDPGHLQVVGGGLDLVGLDDLIPLLRQEAGVELPLARPRGSPPPSRRRVRTGWRPSNFRPWSRRNRAAQACRWTTSIRSPSGPQRWARLSPTFWARFAV